MSLLRLRLLSLVSAFRDGLMLYVREAPGSRKDYLSAAELHRVGLVAVLSGVVAFVLAAISLSPRSESLFPSPADTALAAVTFVGLVDAKRRLAHGRDSYATPARPRA